ncbi:MULTISPECIES: hypothetical protein [unclassified Gemella]|uniref:hypothetical protein n=1 Tax=unclassified Gemella TaxID=2624949 RepID=UPI001C03FC6E|nr:MULTISPECIES: hypothetical protein [unclassified Gemella]MBU0279220.1 hypothetical protein [Gemella sp. zg-1178]QWQ39325.1 hypothetical protein KMP11_03080 [Gemella sp. zg-570]
MEFKVENFLLDDIMQSRRELAEYKVAYLSLLKDNEELKEKLRVYEQEEVKEDEV